ncbi:SIMPL domain-containing protein [Flavobacterium sp. RHBU_24]|uniref:SIMPL domain-containing protein n=1 Tax=Flavobacterium sp. RHBU_24 TaxID=3391185 RepID=UPI0039850857
MKKIFLTALLATGLLATAQVQQNTPPQINVSGEGKVLVMPDLVDISIGVTNTGADAATVKKANDQAIDAAIKYLKSQKLDPKDYQTQRVSLNKTYDYDKKKYNFIAQQTIMIHLKDITKYDALMLGLTDAGVNTINGVTFKTSKEEQYETEARIKAIADARKKAEDYTKALGQPLGKALMVTDNSQTYYPVVRNMAMMEKGMAADGAQETLAPGEITITANVQISYALGN